MTTIIHSVTPGALNYRQVDILRNTFGEEYVMTEWKPCEPIPDFTLIIAEASGELFRDVIGEEDLISFDEAAEHLASESNPVSDIIHPPGSPEPKLTITDALTVLDMTITENLVNSATPEHIKADLRVLQRLSNVLSGSYPFTLEDDLTAVIARKVRCATAMRVLVSESMAIYQDVMEGKFHHTRNQQPPGDE
ncbi:hypothetical protein SAMN05216302_101465 [Nitrosomonas aestuarii]|uniref:Uncharacterized protein n=1 Tax=Nitrosomonas aestuarii TaxID=52441 RepID=A0A1I4C2U7_9PROT|nr:hypothetical protein [Nitrosomonas aestuarii]SFK75255.1 hypothetical protein SAMN05216302_101465 [Nitrosomonas aestuarii]